MALIGACLHVVVVVEYIKKKVISEEQKEQKTFNSKLSIKEKKAFLGQKLSNVLMKKIYT